VALNIPRDDSSTAAGMLLSSSWFAATKNPGDCEFRLLKLIAGPVPTLVEMKSALWEDVDVSLLQRFCI